MTINSTSGIVPAIWDTMVQIPLYKTLVALEVANVHPTFNGDTIHLPRFTEASAQTYTPSGQAGSISATNQAWTYDTIVVTTYKHSTVYIDEAKKQVINIDQWREMATSEAYAIKNKIDTDVFKNITGADGFTYLKVDASSLQGGTAHRPASASSAGIITLFANAKKILRQANVEEMGDWCAVVTPTVASHIEIKAASSGFNVADATLRNGYAGPWMGFEVYISNNLPSGGCSTVNPTLTATAASSTTCRSLYFGRKKMIDLYLMPPTLRIQPRADAIGSNYTTYTAYGSGLGTKNAARGLNVAVDITSVAE